MERTRSAAVLTTLGALALLTLPASPAGAEDTEVNVVPEGRCDVYRPADGAVDDGIDRCVTGVVPAGATVEVAEPSCPDAVSVPADGDVTFYVGTCGEPEQTNTTSAPAVAEPAAAPTTTTTSTTSTTIVPPPPPPAVTVPSGGASTARPATAEVVTDPAASVRLTRIARPATVERDDAPLVMLFALALLAVALLGLSRMRAERA